MNPLLSNYLWQISEAHLPELQYKLRNSKTPFSHILPAEFRAKIKSSSYEKAYNEYFTRAYSTDKRVLVLPVQGELSRSSYWGFGNDFFIRQINAAAKDPDYVGAVLDINSPGGTADSTPEFGQAVANFKKAKPILSLTAYCGSAAYWLASQTSEVMVVDQAATSLGSIGTLLIYENYTEYLKMQGISSEIMRASASTDKARVNWIEPLSEEARAGLQAMLDACQKEFAGAVKRGRAGKITSNEVFTGKMYSADDAIRLGLADSKGNLASAVNRVLELAK